MSVAVDEAADVQEALTFCRVNRPDVILLDWNMPVMSGMEFLGAFNDLDYGREERPRVVFCTTENSIDHIRAAIEAGADEYVDRKSGVEGKRVSVRVDLGGRRNNKKKKHRT